MSELESGRSEPAPRRRRALPSRRGIWQLIRTDGGPAVALAVLVFAASLAGRAPVWLAAPIGLATLFAGLALLAAGRRRSEGEAGDAPEPAAAAAAEPAADAAHTRAAALCGHVLLIVLAVAVVINAAQGWMTSFPWFQLLLTGLGAYLAGLLWYRRRPR